MNFTMKLAYSQLIVNRRRSTWTLLGIVLSTALIAAVCSLVASGSSAVVTLAGDQAQHGMLFVMLLFPAVIVSAIIIAMSVVVISNSFRASAAERTAQFGILKSTGATKRQISATVIYESVLLSAVGIPVGAVLGLILAYVGVAVANTHLQELESLAHVMIQELTVQVNFVVSLPAVLVSAVMSFGTVLYSAYRPARRAARIPAIDSIRGAGEVQVSAKQVRTSAVVGKLFGFEGVLAAKSLKRSRRNFRASVVALTIAVILFVVANGVMGAVGRLEDMMFGMVDATVIVDYTSAMPWYRDEYGEWSRYIAKPLDSKLASEITERLTEFGGVELFAVGGDMQTYTDASLIVLDTENYARLAEKAGVPPGSNILLNHYAINDRGRVVITEPVVFEGQTVQLVRRRDGDIREIELHGVLTADELPPELFPVNPAASVRYTIVIPYGEMRGFSWMATPGDKYGFMEHARLVMEEFFPGHDEGLYMEQGFSVSVFGTDDFIRVMNLGISVAGVFVFSFTMLLALIGLTSVVGTISANVRLREREFAVLQSIGMTRGGLRRMLDLESVMCSARSLGFGLPVAVLLGYLIHMPIREMFPVPYQFPWQAVLQCVVGVFAITWLTMRLSVRGKIKSSAG